MDCKAYRANYDAFSGVLGGKKWQAWFDHGHHCDACGDWRMAGLVEAYGVAVADFPCVHLAYYSTMMCDMHSNPWECDVTLVRAPDGTFGIPVRDGGESMIVISLCPWCGKPANGPNAPRGRVLPALMSKKARVKPAQKKRAVTPARASPAPARRRRPAAR